MMSDRKYMQQGADAAQSDQIFERKTKNPYSAYSRGHHYWQRGYNEWKPEPVVEESRVDRLVDFAQKRIDDLPEGDEQYAMQALLDLILVIREEAA